MYLNKELEELLVEETEKGQTFMRKGHNKDKALTKKDYNEEKTKQIRKEYDKGKIYMKKEVDQGNTNFNRKGNQQRKCTQQFYNEKILNLEESLQSQQKYPIQKKIELLDFQKTRRSLTGPLLQSNIQDAEVFPLYKEFCFEENAQFYSEPLLPKEVQLEKSLDQEDNTQLKQETPMQKRAQKEKTKWNKCCCLNSIFLGFILIFILYIVINDNKGYSFNFTPDNLSQTLWLFIMTIPYFIKVHYIDEFQNYPIQSVFLRRLKFITNILLRITQLVAQILFIYGQIIYTDLTFTISVVLFILPVQYIIVYSYCYKNTNYAFELAKDYFTGGYSWKSYNEDLSYFRITHFRFLFYLIQDIGFTLIYFYSRDDYLLFNTLYTIYIILIRNQFRFSNFQWQIKKQQEEMYEHYQSKVGWIILSCLPIILLWCFLIITQEVEYHEYPSEQQYALTQGLSWYFILLLMIIILIFLVCCFRKKLNPVAITPLDLQQCPQRHQMKYCKKQQICSLCQKKEQIFRYCNNCKFNRYICIKCTVDICRKYQKKLKKKKNVKIQKLFSFQNYSIYRHQCENGHQLKFMNELKYPVARCNRLQCKYYKQKFLVKKGSWHCLQCEISNELTIDICNNCILECKTQYIYQEYQTIQLKCLRGHPLEEEEIDETTQCYKCFKLLDEDQQTAWYCHTCTDYVICNSCREDNHFEEFENRELFYFFLKNPERSLFQNLKDIFKKMIK